MLILKVIGAAEWNEDGSVRLPTGNPTGFEEATGVLVAT